MVNHFSNDLDLLDLKYFLILQCYIYICYTLYYMHTMCQSLRIGSYPVFG